MRWRKASPESTTTAFDLLRSRVEVEIERPAVIAVTSSSLKDGKEFAARSLAQSLASAGYATLYLDTSPSSVASPVSLGRCLEDVARLVSPNPAPGGLATLAFGDPHLHKSESQRSVRSTFDILRTKFEYVVISTEHGVKSPFATSQVAAADAVFATVRKGRRRTGDDRRLSEVLDLLEERFVGIIAMERGTIVNNPTLLVAMEPHPETRRRDVAEAFSST